MDYIEEAALKTEIAHILDSGVNEERIFEMVKGFINNRPTITVADKLTMRDEFAKSAMQGLISTLKGTEVTVLIHHVPKDAYDIADVMLKEREL
jgi:hypothetical protein